MEFALRLLLNTLSDLEISNKCSWISRREWPVRLKHKGNESDHAKPQELLKLRRQEDSFLSTKS